MIHQRLLPSLLLCLSILSGLGCVPRQAQQTQWNSLERGEFDAAIVGGRAAGPGLAAQVVAVYDLDSKMLCTGTLIAKNFVLTAAHCLRDPQDNILVLFGGDLNQDNVITLEATAVRVHPDYQKSRLQTEDRSDIALVKIDELPSPLFFPAELPSEEDQVLPTDLVYLAGYGETDFEKNDSKLLRMTFRKGVKSVAARPDFLFDIRDGHGTCKGDSGGPLLLEKNGKFVVMGLDSIGVFDIDPQTRKPLQNPCRSQVLFTNVVHFLPWIKQTMKEL